MTRPDEARGSSSGALAPEAAAARYEEERRHGRRIAAGAEGIWGWSGPSGQIRAERRAAFVIQTAGLGPGAKCLELGCGTGEFTRRLAQAGCVLTGIELSPDTAALCRARLDDRAEIVVGNIETGEGLEGRTFDAIVGVSVLHHVNVQMCLATTFPHLRPGGAFAFSEPNMANPQVWAERHMGLIRRWRRITAHEAAFRVGELRALFERAGLVVNICEPYEFLHPATPALLIPAVLALEKVLEKTPLRAIAGSIRVAGRRP